jgi:hypothetical protein
MENPRRLKIKQFIGGLNMSVLDKLTEGIVNRDLKREGAALMEKWERTGLLEGLGDDYTKNSMARLLENQASQLLREASTMAGGDVEGFASVAFPIVRRVFGSLIANDLVSVQPMSLPSGLIFFLDFTQTDSRLGDAADVSIYGGNVVASQVTGGVDLSANDGGGFYNLRNGYASPLADVTIAAGGLKIHATGAFGGMTDGTGDVQGIVNQNPVVAITPLAFWKYADLDPDVSGSQACILHISASLLKAGGEELNEDNLSAIGLFTDVNGTLQRRLTKYTNSAQDVLQFVVTPDAGVTVATLSASLAGALVFHYATADNFDPATALGAVKGASEWLLESTGDQLASTAFAGEVSTDIPEIDIKVDSVAVTAISKKLKAKWTPELGQDLNAYHNLDAEVELTSILSEHIALEIDREILEDLIVNASAGTLYWSRLPGRFVNRETGADHAVGASIAGPDFTGTVSEWYETLVETINDVSAAIHRKTLRGGANFLVTSPEVANLLEFTSGFRANVTADSDTGTIGAVNVGSMSKKWDVYVDPYFRRNLILVGRKGGSFLESGYVYAPYVPLQVTPTIFGTEDFVPRKGVMTRYAKKMVRPDMYGLVVVKDLI